MTKQYGFKFFALPASGFFGKSMMNKVRFIINFLLAVGHWIKFILQNKFKAVIVSGGFSSLVPLLGAIMLNKPFFILEQNCIPGRVTKYFARYACETYLAFPLAISLKGNFYYVGNPLRQALANQAQKKVQESRHNQLEPLTVLILGGSLGARALNFAAAELANKYPEIKFIIQTGKRDYGLIKEKIQWENCRLIDFTLTPEKNYSEATLAITRAGGMVLSELLAFGIPSIIVPFPYATDRHQQANAQFFANEGVSIILNQDHLHELEAVFKNLIMDKERLKTMRENAARLAKYNANEVIAQRISKCLAN